MKLLTVLTLVLTLLATGAVPGAGVAKAASEAPIYMDGTYDLPFTVLEDGKETASVMDDYTVKPAQLTVSGGVNTVDVALTNSDWIVSLQTEQADGSFAAVANVTEDAYSEASQKYERTVRFTVADPTAKLNAKVRVVIPAMSYDNTYTVQFKFDASAVPLALALPEGQSVGLTVYKDGTDAVSTAMAGYIPPSATLYARDGSYYVAFVLSGTNAVQGLKYGPSDAKVDSTVLSEAASIQKRVLELEVTDLTKRLDVYLSINEGPRGVNERKVQFGFDPNGISLPVTYTIYKDGTNDVSSLASYLDSLTGTLKVRGGKYYASFTLKSSSIVPVFQFEKNGMKVDATVLGANADADTRVLEIEVPDLSKRLNAYLTVSTTVGGRPYVATHTVQFGFAANAPLPAVSPAPKESDPQTIAFSVYKDGTDETSEMAAYTASPGKLYVRGGNYYTAFALSGSEQISALQYDLNGTRTDAAVIGTDQAANKRFVELQVTDLSKKLNVYGTVQAGSDSIPFKVQFQFDLTGLRFPIGFSVLKDGTSDPSEMAGFVTSPGTLTVKDGGYRVAFALSSSSAIPTLQYEADGEKVDAATLETNELADTRLAEIGVADLSAGQTVYGTAQMGPSLSPFTVQFKFDKGNLPFPAQLTSGSTDPADPTDPTEPTDPGDPSEPPLVLAAGDYTVGFKVLKDGTDESSTLEGKLQQPASLTVRNGQISASFTLESSSSITSFKAENNGAYAEATTVSTNAANDTRVVKVPVADLTKKLNVQTTIDIPSASYHGEYTVQVQFDLASLKTVLKEGAYKVTLNVPAEAAPYINASTSGLEVKDGQNIVTFGLNDGATITKLQLAGTDSFIYPVGTLRLMSLLAAAAPATTVKFEVPNLSATYNAYLLKQGEETETPFAVTFAVATGGGNSGGSGPVESTDGYYTLTYTILKSGESDASVMDDYVQHPGWLQLSGSRKYAYIVLNQSKEITSLSIGGKAVSNEGENKDANTRLVRFDVTGELPATLHGNVKVDWDAMNYHNAYPIDVLLESQGGKTSDPHALFPSAPGGTGDGTDGSAETPTDGGGTTGENGSSGGSTTGGTAPAVKLSDIGGHWAKAAIEQAVALGFVGGYTDGTFRPNGEVSRAEFATMLARALKLEAATDAPPAFKDAANIPAWAKTYVAQVAGSGIIGGYEDGSFRAGDKVSRAQLAVMIVRAAGLQPDDKSALTFADAGSVPAWAKPYVAAAVKAGLINGRSGNLFAPGDNATRAEAVTLILKVLSLAGKS